MIFLDSHLGWSLTFLISAKHAGFHGLVVHSRPQSSLYAPSNFVRFVWCCGKEKKSIQGRNDWRLLFSSDRWVPATHLWIVLRNVLVIVVARLRLTLQFYLLWRPQVFPRLNPTMPSSWPSLRMRFWSKLRTLRSLWRRSLARVPQILLYELDWYVIEALTMLMGLS